MLPCNAWSIIRVLYQFDPLERNAAGGICQVLCHMFSVVCTVVCATLFYTFIAQVYSYDLYNLTCVSRSVWLCVSC